MTAASGEGMCSVTLPAGWIEATDGAGTYYRRTVHRTGHVDVDIRGVVIVPFGNRPTDPNLVRELGGAIIEAADLFAQILARPASAQTKERQP